MTGTAPTASQPDRADPLAAMLAADIAMLDKLAAMAMDMARLVHGRAHDNPKAVDANAAGQAFWSPARAVRLTIALKHRLIREARAEALRNAAVLQNAERRGAVAAKRDAAIELSGYAVAEALKQGELALGKGHPEVEVERLLERLVERLDREDEADLLHKPLARLVGRVCLRLGAPPPWDFLREPAPAAAPEPPPEDDDPMGRPPDPDDDLNDPAIAQPARAPP